jgi:lantibiotic modifying enzyme
MLMSPQRHEPLAGEGWSEDAARAAIARIVARTHAEFDAPSGLWPLHPDDVDPDGDRPLRGLYLGAAGIIWALLELGEADRYHQVVEGLDAAICAEPDDGEEALACWMLGRSGILALAERLGHDPGRADALASLIEQNIDSPARELLYGNPGTMVAAATMWDRTGDERWAGLWRAGADRLIAERETDGLWTQLIGRDPRPRRYLGAGHGYVGNVWSLLRGGSLLSEVERRDIERRAIDVVTRDAVVEDNWANWPPLAGESLTTSDGTIRVQWCHGAPGVVTSLAAVGRDDEDWSALLESAGNLIWDAGPVATGVGICHGTAGNGYALLALWKRTGDTVWLERAQQFAMHAAGQVEQNVAQWGFARHSLFTGDTGVALFLRACLEGDDRLPTLDWL